jgi:phage terminase large subunit-like protein
MATRRREPDERPVTAADVTHFIERYCRVPEGPLVGRPLKLADFQVDFLRGIYDNPHGPTRRAFLSTGKKNGKSALAASLMLAHLCGPPARPNSQLYSTALNRAQAALVFDAAAKMIRLNPELERAVRIMESAKTLVCGELGTPVPQPFRRRAVCAWIVASVRDP